VGQLLGLGSILGAAVLCVERRRANGIFAHC
jgi:hypothetical protein